MIKLAMITECWTPQSSHRDTFFSIYLVSVIIIHDMLSQHNQESHQMLLRVVGVAGDETSDFLAISCCALSVLCDYLVQNT